MVREDPVRRGLLYAGTERGVYVSFDDGAFWQPLQLNLPVTSIRDIAVHGDDLVIATHGRAFWVMDDIAPLRQMTRCRVAKGGVYLFAPATAYRVRPGNQEGTPLPLDEPQVDNAPVGLYIDYYLPDAPHTPVVIDVFASDGALVRRWSSAQPPKPVDPKSVDYTTHWIVAHPVPVAEAGAHRFVWDFHQGDAGRTARSAGNLHGAADRQRAVRTRAAAPRACAIRASRASDADLRAQYELARQVAALRAEVAAARAKAEAARQSSSPGERARALRARRRRRGAARRIPTIRWARTRTTSPAFSISETALDYLESAVESADAAPTPDMRIAYAKLSAIYRANAARVEALANELLARSPAGLQRSGVPALRGRRGIAPAPAGADRPCARTRRSRS